ESVCPDIDVSLRLNLARSAHDRGEILALRFSGLHGCHVLAALMNREADDERQHNQHPDTDSDFFPSFHSSRHIRGNLFPGVTIRAITLIFQENQRSPPVTVTGTHPLLRACPRESSRSD